MPTSMRTPKNFFFKGVHLVLIEMVDCTEGSYFRNINVQINPIGYDFGHDLYTREVIGLSSHQK